jgi:adenosylcobinamide kinase/adenosylcobinamide-phosphate guanylyltransferase
MNQQTMLVTGGARSGKSTYAEDMAKSWAGNSACAPGGVLYIATAAVLDDEMRDRVRRHRARRPASWQTWERHRNLSEIAEAFDPETYACILLDCLGNMLNNLLYEEIADPDGCPLSEFDRVEQIMLSEISALFDFAEANDKSLVFVTNEVGMGLVPEHRLSRYFRDILGRANHVAAQRADKLVLLVSGVPVAIK